MRRGVAVRLVAVAFGVLLALGMLEAVLRYAPPWVLPCFDKEPGIWEPHPHFGWFHAPGVSGWGQGCFGRQHEWRGGHPLNTHGLRDREHDYAKPPGVLRVLVLGDSFTEAAQVEMNAGYVPLLEQRLSTPQRRVEVLNAGTSAWSTDNELLFFRQEGQRYSPDLVLLAFTADNDVAENVPALGQAFAPQTRKPTFTLENGALLLHDDPIPLPPPPGFGRRIRDVLWRQVRIYPLLRKATDAVAALVPRAHAAPPIHPGFGFALPDPLPPEWQAAWQLTEALVRQLRREVEATGARFAVALVPSKLEVGGPRISLRAAPAGLDVRWERENVRGRDFLAEERIVTCELLAPLHEHLAATGRNGYFLWDIHWSPEGHAIAADALAHCLAPLLAATR